MLMILTGLGRSLRFLPSPFTEEEKELTEQYLPHGPRHSLIIACFALV
jgi:hypothetical protein